MVKPGQLFQRIFATVLVPVCACGLPIHAAEAQPGSATTQGTTRAEVVSPLTIETLSDLHFGAIISDAARDGSVRVDPVSGTARYNAGASAACGAAADCGTRPALFAVTGETGRRYRILPPQAAEAFRIDGGGTALSVTDLVARSENHRAADLYGVLDQNGTDRILLGGTLLVPAGTPRGKYSAEIRLVVMYD